MGSIEKLEYICTATNLLPCNGTMIVLKMTLLNSVSAFTNFVIRKRDKNKKLSCRRETARRLMSLNILLSHSWSLKVIGNDTVE